jgi:hypothetical protein
MDPSKNLTETGEVAETDKYLFVEEAKPRSGEINNGDGMMVFEGSLFINLTFGRDFYSSNDLSFSSIEICARF